MRTTIVTLILLLSISAVSFSQGLVDEFAISNTNDLTGHFDWIKLGSQVPTTASWGVSSQKAQPYNPGGDGNQGAIVLDTLLNASATAGLRVSAVIAQVPTTNNFKNVLFGFITTKDSLTMAGYGGHLQKNTGTDAARLRRISTFNAPQLFDEFAPSGVAVVPAANLTREWLVGDTVQLIYYPDGRKTFGLRTPGGAWDTVTTTDVTTSLSSGFYFAIWGLQSATAIQLDHLTVNLISAGGGGGGTTDTQGPTIAAQSLYPSNWVAATTGSITVHLTDNFGLDSVYIKFRPAGGTYGDSLKIRCGNTADTTVVWNISAKAVGNYEWHVRVRDDTGNVTTGSTNLFTVSGSHQWQGFISSIPVWALDNANSGGVAPSVDVRTLDYNGVDVLIWFPGTRTSSQTVGEYWVPQYSEPPTGLDSYIESNGTGTRWRPMVRDSLTARGGKYILDLGGAGTTPDADWTFITADSTRTQGFADSALAYAKLRGYDGVSTNWEFPGAADRDNLSRLLRILRRGLNAWPVRGMLISWTSGSYSSAYDATQHNANVDVILPMMYSYGQGAVITHNTALFNPCGNPCPGGGCVVDNSGIKTFLAQGFDTSKIAMVTTFENIWITQTSVAVCGSRTGNPVYTSYSNTLQKLSQYPSSYNWSDVMKVPYLIYTEGSTQTVAQYENQQSLIEKLKYGESLNLKWFSVWDVTRGHLANPPAGHTAQELQQTITAYIGGDQETTSVPIAPVLVSPANNATGVDKSNVVLRWNRRTTATSYYAQLSVSSAFGTTVVSTATTDTFLIVPSGVLTFDAPYYWHVAAVNSGGQGAYSSAFTFRTAAQPVNPPTTPALVSPAANATNVSAPISFRWDLVDSDSLTGWDFQLGVGTDTASLTLVQSITSLTDTQYVFNAAIPYSTVHWWRVRAKNGAGASGYTAYRKFTTSTAPFVQNGKNQRFAIVDHNGKKVYTTLGELDLTPRFPSEVFRPDSGTYAVFVSRLDGKVHLMDWNGVVDSATFTPHTHSGYDITSGLVALERTAAGERLASGTTYPIGGKRVFVKTSAPGDKPYPDSIRVTDLPSPGPGKVWIGGADGYLHAQDTAGWGTAGGVGGDLSGLDPDSTFSFLEEFTRGGLATVVNGDNVLNSTQNMTDQPWALGGFGGTASTAITINSYTATDFPGGVMLDPSPAVTMGAERGGWLGLANTGSTYSWEIREPGVYKFRFRTPATEDSVGWAIGIAERNLGSALSAEDMPNTSEALMISGGSIATAPDTIFGFVIGNSTINKVNLLTPFSANSVYKGMIVVGASDVKFYLTDAGSVTYNLKATVNTNLPATGIFGSPFIGIWNYGADLVATGKDIKVDYFYFKPTSMVR